MIGLLLNAMKAAGKDVWAGVRNNIRSGHPGQPDQQQPAQPYTPPPTAAASPMDPGPVALPQRPLPQMTNPVQMPQVQDPTKRRMGAMDVY